MCHAPQNSGKRNDHPGANPGDVRGKSRANHQRTKGYQPHLCHPADCKLGEFQKIIAQFCRRYPRTADLPGRKTLCFTAGCTAFGGRTKTAGHGNQLYLHPFCPSIGIVQYQIGDGRHSSPLCQSPNLPGDRTKIKGIENRPGGLHCRIYRRRNEPDKYQI